ncbi:hypothetical protein [Mizugakiibacter sediminis]|uniref:Nucleotidyltransferase n=1 Tax=Mizugakiibacter sediminis TaxID=1475481 RepID=A0A0U1PC58_9GAMM|nr:hypothetical protein [Mizugakiibacter sediminis]
MRKGEIHRIHAQDRLRQNRRRIALEAARLMSEHGIRDFHRAKTKAAERLGVGDEQSLPRNHEIEDALREHQRLFRGADQPLQLRRRREAAREALRFFARFEPRLVGAVLDGTADAHSAVCLHLHTDAPDEVGAFLRERGIPFELQARRLRLDRERQAEFPVYLFAADDVAIDITVLPHDALRQAPLDRVNSERPMRRASLAALEALLAQDEIAAFEQEGAGRSGG